MVYLDKYILLTLRIKLKFTHIFYYYFQHKWREMEGGTSIKRIESGYNKPKVQTILRQHININFRRTN
jgi:hypothetical protein